MGIAGPTGISTRPRMTDPAGLPEEKRAARAGERPLPKTELETLLYDTLIRERVEEGQARELTQRLFEALVAALPMHLTVAELRAGEEHDGPLESTDLYFTGRGIRFLINIPVGNRCTYTLIVDGRHRKSGAIVPGCELSGEMLR